MKPVKGTLHYPDTYSKNSDHSIAEKATMISKSLEPFYFFEGPSIRKVHDWYILSYQRSEPNGSQNGKLAEIGWAYCKNPFGDSNDSSAPDIWHYGGVIVSNLGQTIKDPYSQKIINTFYGQNNHGGMVEINGKWYQIYHRATGNGLKRQSMVEEISFSFNDDGTPSIKQAEMTSQGFSSEGLFPFCDYYAAIACYEIGGTASSGQWMTQSSLYPVFNCTSDGNYSSSGSHGEWYPVQDLRHHCWLGYKYFNFESGISDDHSVEISLSIKEYAAGKINIYSSDAREYEDGKELSKTLIGTISLSGTDKTEHIVNAVLSPETLTGKKAIYLEFISNQNSSSSKLCDLNKIGFSTIPKWPESHEHSYQATITAPTCTEQGYTTHICSCGYSYKDSYTDALDHNFVNGRCTRCTEKDPAYLPQCISKKSASLAAGKLLFTLGGHELGEYTFTKSGNNWTIQNAEGKYLGFANNALSDNAFGWTYTGGRFQTSVTTTTTSGNSGGIFGWLFGGGNRTTTTTYYLAYAGGKITVSTGNSGANATFAVQIENLNHSFDSWQTAAGNRHVRTCSVCGAEESENCAYGDDHKCVCGRTDPGLTYVTATFVTGEGASTVPKAQTVIRDEGKIIRPADPTKIGYLFDGWGFDFTTVLSSDVTITAKWVECTNHHYVNGVCTKCGAKDPAAVPLCSGDVSASLAAGKLLFTLGGHNLGEYTFAKSGNNWTIQDAEGKYLGFASNALSDNAFGWMYTNGRFQTSVTTTTTSGNSGGIFGWLFGGFGGGNRTTTTTYYLVYTNGRIAVSTSTNGANAMFTKHVESDTHSFGAWTSKNGVHTRKCSICGTEENGSCVYGDDHKCTTCGAYDPTAVKVEVSVSLSQRTSGGNQGGFGGIFEFLFGGFGGGNRTTTTYTATINARATGTTVARTEYSTNNGASWTSGTIVTSNSQIGAFLIRITDSNGTVHNYSYDDENITED